MAIQFKRSKNDSFLDVTLNSEAVSVESCSALCDIKGSACKAFRFDKLSQMCEISSIDSASPPLYEEDSSDILKG